VTLSKHVAHAARVNDWQHRAMRRRRRIGGITAWCVGSALYGVAMPLAPMAAVSTLGSVALYVSGVATAPWLWRWSDRHWRPGTWLLVAAYAALLAAMFWAANEGLALLHGVTRAQRADTPAAGGLELWMVLCPGVVSLALASAARAACLLRLPR